MAQYPWLLELLQRSPSLDEDAFRAHLSNCSAVSGYDFRATRRITASEVSRTCVNPSCASVGSELLGLTVSTELGIGPLLRAVLSQFARPMVEYCWQYRLPSASCPADPEAQLSVDFGDMLSDCEKSINTSIIAAMTSLPGSDQPQAIEACTLPACIGFVKRFRSLSFVSCPRAFDYLSSPFEALCTNVTWSNYEYLPGRVPAVPAETAAPEVPLSTAAPLPQESETATQPPTSTIAANVPATKSSVTLVSTVAVVVPAILAVVVFVWLRRRRRSKQQTAYETDAMHAMATNFTAVATKTPLNRAGSSQLDFLPVDCARIAAHTLTQVRLIAASTSGLVFLVRNQNGTTFASKQLAKRQLSDAKIDAFIGEIAIAASLQHPQIVQFIGVAGISRHHVQAIFEYMEGGDLRRYLDTTPWQPWTRAKVTIALDVAKALQYIHSYTGTTAEAHTTASASSSSGTSGSGAGTVVTTGGIVHRDLKSRNIMLTKELRAKVGDFGVSRTLSTQATMTAGVGTSRWLAPEVIVGSGGAYDAACDVYSFGVVLTELDSHRMPYYDCVTATGEELPEIVILSRVADGSLRPSLLSSCVEVVALLATRCLSYDPTQRPSASELVEELKMIVELMP